jgi:glycosyltransferase involved in cell wall biosynthesis
MATAARVSVILPTFNRARFIAASVQSVLDQTVPVHELLIVDDGSDDGTSEVIKRFGNQVTYCYQPNQGKTAAIETGLGIVTGDFIWVMDDDDIVPPTALAALLKPLMDDERAAFSYGEMVKFRESEDGSMIEGDHSVYPWDDERPFYVKLMEDCFITGHPCVLARRSAMEALRPLDRSVTASVDYYLYLGMGKQGDGVGVEEVVLYQRQHSGARGPLHNRYREADRNQRWIESDRRLVSRLLDELPLSRFAPRPDDERAARIQKAAIAARKKIWPVALAELEAALVIDPKRPLDQLELFVLSRCLGSRYGLDELYEDRRIIDRLRASCEMRPHETGIRSEIGRPLFHRIKLAIREKNWRELRLATTAWFRLMDTRSGVAALSASLSRNLSHAVH